MKKNKSKNLDLIKKESAEWARWIALYEAVNIIMDKAESKKIPLENIVFKPLDIRDYISSTEDIILRKILSQEHDINVAFKDEVSNKNEYTFV
jgi:hypothetical protein